jgi:hypothetical protein
MFRTGAAVISVIFVMATAQAADSLKEDSKHVKTWNRFADAMYELHKQRISKHEIITSEKIGGYYNDPDYYREVTYRSKKTGNILSRIQWEKDNPDVIHVIEMYFHDDKGRVMRDYTAAYLPGFRNAPVQTLVAFHGYNKDLHSFRSFDANGNVVFERCEGRFQGEHVDLAYEDYDIETMKLNPKNSDMTSPVYQACFKGLPDKAGKYLDPKYAALNL